MIWTVLALCMFVGAIVGIVIGVRRIVRQVRPQLAAKRENERLTNEARTLELERQLNVGADAADATRASAVVAMPEGWRVVYGRAPSNERSGICAFCQAYRVVTLEPFGADVDHTVIQTCAPCWQRLQERLTRFPTATTTLT